MGLSESFYDCLAEISQIDKWEKLPKDDARIIKLQSLANETTEVNKKGHARKGISVYKDGKFVRVFNSAAEAAECFGTNAAAIQAVARGERRSIGEFEFRYVDTERD